MKNIIEISNLCKKYGNITAVDDLSFKVKEGELFAFLGVNGAGKSTTINIMCGELEMDSGKIIIDELDLKKCSHLIKNRIGVVFQNSVLDQTLSVYDNLKTKAALYGIYDKEFKERLEEVSRLLEFKDILKRNIRNLSGGQKRRIDIARALIHNPKILILDEPTTGLDPQTRKMLWDCISTLRKRENMTVFLTTHYMEEAADADYVVIIDNGKIKAEGTPHDLKSLYSGDFITIYGVDRNDINKLGYDYDVIRGGFKLYVPNTLAATKLILEYPELFKDYEISKGKMDDIFLSVTGKNLSGGNI